mgnify:CR=1 FL=1
MRRLQADSRTVDAVVHNLLVIGEAARCLPAAIKEQREDIDWIAINGLRNRIAHEYFGLSLSVIWSIVQNDLPLLARQLASWRDTDERSITPSSIDDPLGGEHRLAESGPDGGTFQQLLLSNSLQLA